MRGVGRGGARGGHLATRHAPASLHIEVVHLPGSADWWESLSGADENVADRRIGDRDV